MSLMFFKREVEQELRETPQMLTTFRFKSDSDFEKYLSVEDKHCLYPHEQQQSCKVKGNFSFKVIVIIIVVGDLSITSM